MIFCRRKEGLDIQLLLWKLLKEIIFVPNWYCFHQNQERRVLHKWLPWLKHICKLDIQKFPLNKCFELGGILAWMIAGISYDVIKTFFISREGNISEFTALLKFENVVLEVDKSWMRSWEFSRCSLWRREPKPFHNQRMYFIVINQVFKNFYLDSRSGLWFYNFFLRKTCVSIEIFSEEVQ